MLQLQWAQSLLHRHLPTDYISRKACFTTEKQVTSSIHHEYTEKSQDSSGVSRSIQADHWLVPQTSQVQECLLSLVQGGKEPMATRAA